MKRKKIPISFDHDCIIFRGIAALTNNGKSLRISFYLINIFQSCQQKIPAQKLER